MLVGPDLSDRELAAELGVARSTISHWRSRGLPQAVTCLLPYLNPMRPGPRPISAADAPSAPADVAGVPVEDRRLAEMLAVLADEFEALNERGQESLCTRFWHAHPDLRERALARQGRRLARLAGDFGAGGPSRRGGGLTAAPTPSQRG